MKQAVFALLALVLVTTVGYSQAPYRVLTSPRLPPRDALERMNLAVGWHARVKVEGNRDGIFSVQHIPGRPNAQIVVQTYAGAVYLYDAENGDLVWKTNVGERYWTPQPVGHNSQSIFATRRNVLHVLNRTTGAQRVYTVDTRAKLVTFGYELGFSPSAAPIADEESLYLAMGDRIHTLYIPDFAAEAKARARFAKVKNEAAEPSPRYDPGESSDLDSPQPDFSWSFRLATGSTEFPLLVAGSQVSILTSDGSLVAVDRFQKGPRVETFEFETGRRVAAPAGLHGTTAYIGCDDANLYAVDLRRGDLLWRHVSGAAIQRRPEVNDYAVFASPDRIGLRMLNRGSGREVWTNRDASRFLASTYTNVYALDHIGRFFVIDARRGTTLAKYDLTDWAIPVANDLTDRIYLAANDGQVLCLKNRGQTKPLIMKSIEGFMKEEEKKEIKGKVGRWRAPADGPVLSLLTERSQPLQAWSRPAHRTLAWDRQ